MKHETRGSMANSSAPESSSREQPGAKMTETLGSKTREWETARKKEGPLRLLDLPVDILRLIVKEACPSLCWFSMLENHLLTITMRHCLRSSIQIT